MDNGWIKLHRKLLTSTSFENEKCLKIWIWCLLKASRQEKIILIGRQKVEIKKGQFVMGSLKASDFLEMAKSTVWFWLDFLERNGQIGIKKTNKYSIISIKNWIQYQCIGNKSDSNQHADGNQIGTYKKKKELKEDIPANAGRLKTNPKDMRKIQSEDPDDLPSIQADTGEIKDPNEKKKSVSTLLMEWAEERRSRPFLQKPKQFVALKKMLTNKISPTEIAERYKELESTDFGKRVGIDFMSVFNSFEKKR